MLVSVEESVALTRWQRTRFNLDTRCPRSPLLGPRERRAGRLCRARTAKRGSARELCDDCARRLRVRGRPQEPT